MTAEENPCKFSLDDYDCVGFDLDCTLAEYNLKELTKLVYESLLKYLIEKKAYDGEFLSRPFEEGEDFLQRGLFMDLKRGNVLKIGEDGVILRATHGTVPLRDDEIENLYGPDRIHGVVKEFADDPLAALSTPHEKAIRCSLDCFDMPCLLLFARIVDQLDKANGSVLGEYDVWPDILEGLYHLYAKNQFANGKSEFFNRLREDPASYYKKWDPEKIRWLKRLKAEKFVFLLTGSFIDFATLTASTCIGDDWKDYFDVIVCYGRKPFFFKGGHPFLKVEGNAETGAVSGNDLRVNAVYSQGNWQELKLLVSRHANVEEPKCLYVGDNLIQDVFAPFRFGCCDSVAVAAELKEDSGRPSFWGSYFESEDKACTYWSRAITKFARICVSTLDVFSRKPLGFRYDCLKVTKIADLSPSNGFHAA